jgi:hypothetical protein
MACHRDEQMAATGDRQGCVGVGHIVRAKADLYKLKVLVQLEAGHNPLDAVRRMYARRCGQEAALWLQLHTDCG